jgi:hypothetical protein
MNAPAAIAAQLVDVRNVGAHKSIKLTLHVPQEQAMAVMEAFGWPTGADPVPVALARLQEATAGVDRSSPAKARGEEPGGAVSSSRRPQKSWHDMSAAEQAGVLCKDVKFHKFLQEMMPGPWKLLNKGDDNERAALIVRAHCGVKSRSEIDGNEFAMMKWRAMVSDYRAWVSEPEVVF